MMDYRDHVSLMLTANGIQRQHILNSIRGQGASLSVTWKSASMTHKSEIVFYFGSAAIADYAHAQFGTAIAPKPALKIAVPV